MKPPHCFMLRSGKTRSASRICTGLSPLPTGCIAFYTLADFEMVGHLGAAPSVSPIRTARIAVFLVPDEMDAHPGLAPGSSVLQTDGSTTLPCARFGKWGGRRVLPPLSDLHRIECWLLHHGLHLKAILRPALPRHGLLYERSAFLTSATEECLAR